MHTIEPELLLPTPRTARYQLEGKVRWGAGCIGLFLLPFFVVGIGALVYAVFLTLTLFFGSVASGHVVSRRVIESDEGSDSYRITYRYRLNGRWYTGQDDVRRDRYPALREGTSVTVQYFALTPGSHTLLQEETTAPGKVRFLWIWIAIWDGVLGLMTYVVIAAMRLQRRLVRYGTPVAATITEKSVKSDSDSTTYQLHYTFRPMTRSLNEGEPITGKRNVGKEEWDGVEEGETLTVLYLPETPKRNDLYRFGAYRAVV